MPRIPDYSNTQVNPISPLPGRSPERLYAEPDSFGAAQGLTALGHDVGDAATTLYNVAQQQEVSDVNTKLAQARGQWTAELAQRAAKMQPGDTSFAATFQQDFGDAISGMGDDLQTRAGQAAFQRGKAELTAHMLDSSTAVQVQAAGVKAKQDYFTTLDANRATLVTDPTQFQSVLADQTASLNDPNGPYAAMGPDARAEMGRQTREQLALSAAQGEARMNPAKALDDINGGKFDQYVTGGSRWMLTNIAEHEQQKQVLDQQRAMLAQERSDRLNSLSAENGFIHQLVTDPTSVSPDQIDASKMLPAQKLQWIGPGGILDKSMRPDKLVTDGSVFTSLFQRATMGSNAEGPFEPGHEPITSPEQLNPYVGNGLDFNSYAQLRSVVAGKSTPDGAIETELKAGFLRTVKSQLTGTNELLHMRDPDGDTQMQKYISWFLPAYDAAKQRGESPVDLLNPDSPKYLGKNLSSYARPMNVWMQDLMRANPGNPNVVGSTGAPAAAAPPPAALDYLKAHPDTRDAFDQKFGEGSAISVLGK